MKVYVIMGNDFPHSVYEKEEDAEKFVKEKMEDPDNKQNGGYSRHIYWRYYEFELQTRLTT